MARNVEIKARVKHPVEVAARAEAIADGPPELLVQRDTFYNVPSGRLKLRTFPDRGGQLIFYRRPDEMGPKVSEYHLHETDRPGSLHETLERALGVRCTVTKRRRLFLVKRTRIHLDEVDGLGHFLELEVVLEEGEAETDGVRTAHALLNRLGVSAEDLVAVAYADLLCAGDASRG